MPRHSRGFTLLEFVIALTLTAILLVIVYSGLQIGIRARHSVASAMEQGDTERVLAHFLRRQLRHVATDVPGTLRFSGHPQGLSFTLRGFRGDPWLYRLQLAPRPAAHSVHLAVIIERTGDSAGAPGASTLSADLLNDIRELRLAYFGRLEHESEAAWHDYWDRDSHPPQLVRLHYRPADGRGTTLFLSVAGNDGNQVAGYQVRGETDR
jgi:general secretion pathway protein J